MKRAASFSVLSIVLSSFCSIAFGQIKMGSVGQLKDVSRVQLNWMQPIKMLGLDGAENTFFAFKGAQYNSNTTLLPVYFSREKLIGSPSAVTVTLADEIYLPLTDAEKIIFNADPKADQTIHTAIDAEATIGIVKKESYAYVKLHPFRKDPNSGVLEKLISFRTILQPVYSLRQSVHTQTYAANSILANGTWKRIAVNADGIFKISFSFLKSIGLDPATINPNNLRVYGNGGGQLPYANAAPRKDDLTENAVFVSDGNTIGVFDSLDYVLFYGQAPDRWIVNPTGCTRFTHQLHQYSDSTYYFITPDLGVSKKVIAQASSVLPFNKTVTSFDDYAFHESEAINIIHSGREWYGEKFDIVNSYSFTFNFPNIDLSGQGSVHASALGRADVPTDFTFASGIYSTNVSCNTTTTSMYYAPFGYDIAGCFPFTPTGTNVSVSVTRTAPTNNQDWIGYLNYVEVNVRRLLSMTGDQMNFRDSLVCGTGNIAKYTLANAPATVSIWDVTDPTNAFAQTTTVNGGSLEFTLPSDSLKEFIAFTGLNYLSPKYSGNVPNQNLHSIGVTDLIMVCPPAYLSIGTTLAQHHATVDGLTVALVTPQQIYNEFSSGSQDVSAIRDFMRMFYKRALNSTQFPKYLLLFGDGSYDNKSFVPGIPTYQSLNSTDPIKSYVSDDFFVLLDDTEGNWAPSDPDQPDAGVGRLPVKSASEAQTALSKILKYSTPPGYVEMNDQSSCSNSGTCSVFGDWRNSVCFVADDEDNDTHVLQAEALANYVDTVYDNFNVNKIYFDAYQQVATPGGDRYPDASALIDKQIEKGCLILNYTGHGGEVGLAHERVIEVSQINGWDNLCNMPLFFTATCEFSRFDNPELTSAGEYCFLNPNGAAIALMSTVRLVFSAPNFTLNYNFYENAQALDTLTGGIYPRLGDLNMLTKSTMLIPDDNNRNFTLLGDPALTLAYPKMRIKTDSVNGNAVNLTMPDTIHALSTVTISGEVDDLNGNKITTFNGLLYPTVYDKQTNVTTLGNDPAGSYPYTFKMQKNILYRGKVSVKNGDFKFTFVVPKDIAYQYGFGRISYYAHDGNIDAQGNYENIIIGGTNQNAPIDNTGPQIQLYMNDDHFVYGGLTNESPEIYAIVNDSNGVNTVGNGIGHDITATLDGNTSNDIVLNDYYVADLNSYKKGRIHYKLSDLAQGNHTLKLKVWDVYNNSSIAITEFVVASSSNLALNHVLNYPNPFTTSTKFYFEQNQCCQSMDVQIQIFTVAGRLVKTINQNVYAEGFRSDGIDWDGHDDMGDNIGRGVYVYRVKVRNSAGEIADKYEKLVILK